MESTPRHGTIRILEPVSPRCLEETNLSEFRFRDGAPHVPMMFLQLASDLLFEPDDDGGGGEEEEE